MPHRERHRIDRIGWLRAAVLGANDGILSTASLVVGVAAANTGHQPVLIAGVAGLVAGAMSMAAGEFVSVSSQSDTERAALAEEQDELATNPEAEQAELAAIYVKRGLDHELARQVAMQLTTHDPLKAHARDELGISSIAEARPVQAALASGAAFTSGAILPLLAAILSPVEQIGWVVTGVSLLVLAILGGLAAATGGAPVWRGAGRVVLWGALAMGVTASIGHWIGTGI